MGVKQKETKTMTILKAILLLSVLMTAAACKHNQKSLNDFMRETARSVRS